ncbi:MAG TPA: PaaI family thioesterase [bacterium]|nr:PaaI family thioesterase [bacterium]
MTNLIKQPASRSCFLCGKQNDFGLKMEWFNNPQKNQVQAEVIIPEHFNGYPGIAHGGIVAAILDETAGRAVMLDGNFEELFVTLKLEVAYRHLTPTNEPLHVAGWIIKRGNNKMKVAANISLADGTVTAECEALVIRPPEEISSRWEPEKPFWRVYD